MAIEDLAPLTYAVISPFFALSTISLLLRIYSRLRVIKSFGLDDYFAVGLLPVNTFQQAIQYMFLYYGCGKHMTTLSAYQQGKVLEWLFIEEVFYFFVHWMVKQTFLSFYLRLGARDRTFHRMIHVTTGLNATALVVNWIICFLQCIPFDAILHRADHPDAKCINLLVLFLLPAIMNTVLDFIILVLPIRTVWTLNMPLKRKISVLAVMGLGGASCLISALRLIVLMELYRSPDLSYVLGKMIIIAALEIHCAVIAVNMPALKGFFKIKFGDSSAQASEGISQSQKLSLFRNQRSMPTSQGKRNMGMAMELGSVSRHESQEELFNEPGQIKVTREVVVQQTETNSTRKDHWSED